MAWQPLSRRGKGETPDSLYEGVPEHLLAPVLDWVDEYVSGEIARLVAVRLRVPLSGDGPLGWLWSARKRMENDDEIALDFLDAFLMFDDAARLRGADDLELLLYIGGSAWQLAGDKSGLERRVSETVVAARDRVLEPGGTAENHLRAAWGEAYGRHPDPTKAYSEAIKAVEAAAAPVIAPNDSLITLGKMLGQMRDALDKYMVVIAGKHGGSVGPVVALMRMLWEGQSDRHGGNSSTVPITQAQAEMAVHAAMALVQWFQSGAVRKRT